ncbi:hypothetical protein FF011L_42970 [Roseimaritima multifibrata]|uniref:Uncharacterized protein n=1 Tax=Roseimaritima multifibrata TaxID=1930274 RepID=A0A517MKX8_9BACT|nr:hypothetical protein FF011L_42970 [Roseimaritima multifibrata]
MVLDDRRLNGRALETEAEKDCCLSSFARDVKLAGDDFNPAHPSLSAVLLAQRAADTCRWRKPTET